MKKKIFSIWSVLLVLVISIAVVVPGCGDGACTGDIEVKATLCDVSWNGTVQYKLTGPGAAAPTIINGTSVNASHSGVKCGNWTCEHVSGGPDGTYLESITPDPTQEVTSGSTKTFTLNFELDQDAWIEFETWTIDGVPIEDWKGTWEYFEGAYNVLIEEWSHIIDVHYTQGVDGCEGRVVAVNETSELEIHWLDADGEYMWPAIHVLDDWCAVNKTPEPPEKVSQVPSVNGEPVEYCTYIDWPQPGICETITLDVETIWMLEKCLNYTKTINWLHIGECEPGPPGESPCCALFDLLVDAAPVESGYQFAMVSCATVELMEDVDVNPNNNTACSSSPLVLWYYPGGLPG